MKWYSIVEKCLVYVSLNLNNKKLFGIKCNIFVVVMIIIIIILCLNYVVYKFRSFNWKKEFILI